MWWLAFSTWIFIVANLSCTNVKEMLTSAIENQFDNALEYTKEQKKTEGGQQFEHLINKK